MSERVQSTVSLVNLAIPQHMRGVIRPNEIAYFKGSSCFGRAAIIGAGLVAEGAKKDQIAMLISQSHGMPMPRDNHWFGHAALIADGKLIDSAGAQAYTRDPQAVAWDAASWPTHVTDLEGKNMAGPEVPADIRAVDLTYDVFTLEDGITAYQSMHPDRSHESWTLQDYGLLYQEFVGVDQTQDNAAA